MSEKPEKQNVRGGCSIWAFWLLFSATLALGCAGLSCQQSSQSTIRRSTVLADLTSRLRIGSEFFLNRTDTRESIEKHFKLMRDNGFTLVRIFIIWDDVERSPGTWDFHRYDWIYDAAASNGILVVATLCAEDPPGWARETSFYHQRTDLDDLVVQSRAKGYIERVVTRYRNHPAQGVWLLENEPTKYNTDAATFRMFGNWLKKKYGTVTELNKQWFRPVRSFADVKIDQNQFSGYWLDETEFLDWKEFNVDNLVDTLTWIRDQVLALDPNHPTHFNVTLPTGDAEGQDVWKEKSVPDILGVSMHAAWAFPSTTPESDFGEQYAFRLDLIGNAAQADPYKPYWVTELQSGPTVYTGQFALNVTPSDLSRWIWDSFGAGSDAVIFWLWSPRERGTEAGEWGLVSLDGVPSARLPIVKDIAETLSRNPILAGMHPQQPRVAILYNRETAILNDLDGRSQNRREEAQDSLLGCYLALLRAHVPTRFVDLDQLKSGEVDKYQVLYAPFSYALDDGAVVALSKYVQKGGTLWSDGLTAWKDETGKVRPAIPGGLKEVFGIEATDIYPVQPQQPYSVTADQELGGELWKLPMKLAGAQVDLRDRDNNPFEVENTFGKGRVYYFGSAVSLAYKLRNNPEVQSWILTPSLQQIPLMPVQLDMGSGHVLFRGLVGQAGQEAILSNWGDTETVTLSFEGQRKVHDASNEEILESQSSRGRTYVSFKLLAGSSAVIVAE